MTEKLKSGTLYVVGTPIGNLGDLTSRAVAVLGGVDAILAEDTRHTRKLLSYTDLHTPLERFDDATTADKTPRIVERLLAGETLALVSDAGMPGISDPGAPLVAACRDAGVEVVPVPGASAAVVALAAAGLPTHAYYFAGFPPRKPGKRAKLLDALAPLNATLVFYESPQRVAKFTAELAARFPNRSGALARELTKLHEEVLRLSLPELAANLAIRPNIKGECVVLVGPEP
ncbi:MAG: 16S rRNA (cytidine(1402)-2'-O)-methyltransferase [Actinomycetia bacterium]|nr:16S rRNA (cytidine(1402)-2'-O)-methyltransferase [Actinomycetes bacterium]